MNPVVTIEMESGGVITAELYPQQAPQSVSNFISLIQKGFYDGLIFSPGHSWLHDPGWLPRRHWHGRAWLLHQRRVFVQRRRQSLKHKRGVLSMARAQSPNSAGSQFFIIR